MILNIGSIVKSFGDLYLWRRDEGKIQEHLGEVAPSSTSVPLPGWSAPSPLLSAFPAFLFYQPDLLLLKCAKNSVRYRPLYLQSHS
jgi:hypothetical protein